MNKSWFTAAFLLGAIGAATVVLRDHGGIPDSAAPPAAAAAVLAPEAAPGLRNRITTDHEETFPVAVPPSTAGQVAGLSAAILLELNAANQDHRDEVFTNLFPALIALDPRAAARLVEAAPPEAGREELLRQATQTWIAMDPAAALAWAGQLADTNEQRRAFTYATLQMAQTDPVAALATASLHQLGDDAVMTDIVMRWAGTDASAALTWVGNQPAGPQRDEMLSRIAFAAARTAPEEAANLVVQAIPPGAVQNDAAISVLHQWATLDFASAQSWAEDFPDGPLRDRALAELSQMGSNVSGN